MIRALAAAARAALYALIGTLIALALAATLHGSSAAGLVTYWPGRCA